MIRRQNRRPCAKHRRQIAADKIKEIKTQIKILLQKTNPKVTFMCLNLLIMFVAFLIVIVSLKSHMDQKRTSSTYNVLF